MWAASFLPLSPPPLQMQSAHMAHLHLWGRFCLKSSQRFRLYDKSRSRLSRARKGRGICIITPRQQLHYKLKERFAAARAPPLTWASHFPIVCGLQGSRSKPYGPFGHLTLSSGKSRHVGKRLGASQRPACTVPGAILPQSGVNLGKERENTRGQRGLSSKKQCVGLRGKE